MPSIGQPVNRVDGRLKITGKATYTADHKIPNLAHGLLITSSIAKGRIVSIDSAEAERIPGVLAVLTHRNRIQLAKDPAKVEPGSPADRALQLLQDDRVLYANQPVAMVVADTLEAARQAALAVKIRYEQQTPSISLEKRLGSAYTPKKVGGGGAPAETTRGNVQAGMAEADFRIEEIYRTPFETHSPMEPHATIAVWEGDRSLTLYDSTQGIFGDRKRMAELFGLQPDNVRVVSLYVGGGFGSKGPTWSNSVLCAMAARAVKRPVKLVLRRQQMFGPVGFRSATRQTITAGAKRDGKLTALRNETYTHTCTFDEFTESATFPTRMMYASANNSTIQRLVRSDIGTPSYTRAPGEAPGSFALEVAMDELAYKLNMDPLEFRLRNYAELDEEKNLPWSTKALKECYRRGAERFGWAKRSAKAGSMKDGRIQIGWGMASSLYPARQSPASARAWLKADGTMVVEAGTQELGGGTYTILTQLAADAVGLPVSKVTFRLGDTRYPETPVSGGSQTTATAGSAVNAAAQMLRQKLFQIALSGSSAPAGAKPEDLLLDGVAVSWKGSQQTTPLAKLFAGQKYLFAEASTKAGDEAKKHSSYSFGAQFVEVRVDSDLGVIRVSRMAGAFGAGRILNAKTARSQFIGGMVWGLGMALHEDTIYDERLGRIVNNNLAEYHVPSNADVPQIDVLWVQEDDRVVSPIGAKGIGEIGITGTAAAISNAIFHATGKRLRQLPFTLDKIMESKSV